MLSEAFQAADCLRVPVDVDIIDRLAQVTHMKTPSGQQIIPSVQWRKDYQTPLLAMLRVLQRHEKLDPQFHPVFETHSKSGVLRAVDVGPSGSNSVSPLHPICL